MNNLACAEFETGQMGSAARTFREALKVYRLDATTAGKPLQRNVALKLAVLKSNVGYVWLRMKRADTAIEALQAAKVNQEMIPNGDDHNLTIAIRDHLVLALLRKGDNNEAYKEIDQVLRIQIELYGPDHPEIKKTLTKVHLLKGGMKCNSNHLNYTAEKVKGCCFLGDDDNNDQRRHHQEEKQLERFEKLLKVPHTWGRASLLK